MIRRDGMTDHDGSVEPRVLDGRRDGRRDIVDAGGWEHWGAAVTGEIDHEQLSPWITSLERPDGREPHAMVERQPMKEHERWTFVEAALRETR